MGIFNLSKRGKRSNKGYNVIIFFYLSACQSYLRKNVLSYSGKKWHERRKMLTPAFHFSILETFMESFIENSNLLVERLEKELKSESFDMFPYVSDCALDIICGKYNLNLLIQNY